MSKFYQSILQVTEIISQSPQRKLYFFSLSKHLDSPIFIIHIKLIESCNGLKHGVCVDTYRVNAV